jgi:amino acid adenylation domain-containing protein
VNVIDGEQPDPPPAYHTSRLDRLFQETAAAHADRLAVSAPDGELSYRELDARADGVARRLRASGAGPGVVVGLCTTRSTHMVVGLVGIVKSGAAYLPIDPSSPAERVRWLLADSGAAIVVAESAQLADLDGYAGHLVVIDEPAEEERVDGETPAQDGDDSDLAYVIYTSGSTGTPKGVMVEHRSVARLFESTADAFGFDENDTWTLFHSIAFDFSVWELWGALLHGGRLVVVPHDTARSPAELLALLEAQAVTVLNQTPSAFRQLVTAGFAELPALRLVILGGERLDVAMLEPWIAARGDERPQLVNMYGITEVTVHASYRPIVAADLERPGISPIGDPLPDLRFLVLDPDGAPVEDGQPGELSIAGPGVARGYLGRDDLTAERFSVLPQSGAAAFRTGDRVARDGGEHVYLGRVDDQIKMRGYRIEPREVEVVVERHPHVSACVVATRDYGDGDVRLVAYVAPPAGIDGGEDWRRLVQDDLDERVAAELPPHMCPSVYVAIDALPMTPNGKVDRGALPAPPAAASPAGEELSSTEAQIAEVWRAVDVDATSRDDDFFDVGGTSLAVVRLLSEINSRFGTDLDIMVLLDGVTIAGLAGSVDEALAQAIH